uniref:Uncharacterized protein n=1 Tax=viral metagenome TaxID=1070528 RepID=A0A6C0FBE7_9ZZZZ|tara:strand:+ start:1146 stop:1544 length:399 start_codon:yes stop_codon:yes gene_type:complete
MTTQYDGWFARFYDDTNSDTNDDIVGILACKNPSNKEFFRTISDSTPLLSNSDDTYDQELNTIVTSDNYAKVHSGVHRIIIPAENVGNPEFSHFFIAKTTSDNEYFKIKNNGDIEGHQNDHIVNILARFTFT